MGVYLLSASPPLEFDIRTYKPREEEFILVFSGSDDFHFRYPSRRTPSVLLYPVLLLHETAKAIFIVDVPVKPLNSAIGCRHP